MKRNPPELVKRVKELWVAGLSAAQIARQIGSLSRNAVIGIVHRAGAPARVSQPRSTRSNAPRRPGAVKLVSLPPPSLEIVSAPVALLDAGAAQCRWPLWDDDGRPEFFVCGAPKHGESMYCAGHAARGVNKAAARKWDPNDPRRNKLGRLLAVPPPAEEAA